MTKFKPGDHVRTIFAGEYIYGEVTIIGLNGKAKVLFDNSDLDYTYYDDDMLELMTPEDVKDIEQP